MHKKSPFQIIFIYLTKEIAAHIWLSLIHISAILARCLIFTRLLHIVCPLPASLPSTKQRSMVSLSALFILSKRCFSLSGVYLPHSSGQRIRKSVSPAETYRKSSIDVYKRQSSLLIIVCFRKTSCDRFRLQRRQHHIIV